MADRLSTKARKASAAAILRKLQAGKPATAAELRQIEDVDDAQDDGAIIRSGEALRVDVRTVAAFFGVTAMCLTKWVQIGMPKVSKGVYDLAAVFRWWQINIADQKTSSKDERQARLRYWTAHADIEETTRDQVRGAVVRAEDVGRSWGHRVSEVCGSLTALETRLPPILEGKNQDEMRELIAAEIRTIRVNHAREGEHCNTKDVKCRKPTANKNRNQSRNKGGRPRRTSSKSR